MGTASKKQHSPAPWKFEDNGYNDRQVIDATGNLVVGFWGDTRDRINGYLIATAPELLHSLQQLVTLCDAKRTEVQTAIDLIDRASKKIYNTPGKWGDSDNF